MKINSPSIIDVLYRRIIGLPKWRDKKILRRWLAYSQDNKELLHELEDNETFNSDWKRFNEIDIEVRWQALKDRCA